MKVICLLVILNVAAPNYEPPLQMLIIRQFFNNQISLRVCRYICSSRTIYSQDTTDFLKSLTLSLGTDNQLSREKIRPSENNLIKERKDSSNKTFSNKTINIFNKILNDTSINGSNSEPNYKQHSKSGVKTPKESVLGFDTNFKVRSNNTFGTQNYAYKKEHNNFNNRPADKAYKKDQRSRNKAYVTNIKTGTQKAQEAFRETVNQIYKINPKGIINFVDTKTKQIELMDILKLSESINLDKTGIDIVDLAENKPGQRIAIVKLVKVEFAIKKYNDHLAKVREQELAKAGYIKKKFTDNSHSKEKLKHVKISWQITLDDFRKQKLQEITRFLERDFKVNLYLAEKNELKKNNWLENFNLVNDEYHHLSKRTLQSRKTFIDELHSVLDEFIKSFKTEGRIENRMIIEIIPKSKSVSSTLSSGMDLREEKRKKRQARLLRHLEKKRSNILQNIHRDQLEN